jgi:type I restriction enzyme S subunit
VVAFPELFYLKSFQADCRMPLATPGMINQHAMPLPQTLDDQREIVAILDAIDRKINLHGAERIEWAD